MAKKRKASNRPAAPVEERSKYAADETFDDSQDEFFAGREKILLDEGPAAKRRRRIEEQGKVDNPLGRISLTLQ